MPKQFGYIRLFNRYLYVDPIGWVIVRIENIWFERVVVFLSLWKQKKRAEIYTRITGEVARKPIKITKYHHNLWKKWDYLYRCKIKMYHRAWKSRWT